MSEYQFYQTFIKPTEKCLSPDTAESHDGGNNFAGRFHSYLQSANVNWSPRTIHSILFSCVSTFPICLLSLSNSGFFCFNSFGVIQHHLNNSILHQGSKPKEKTSNEPYIKSLHVGYFGQFSSKGCALRGQAEYWKDTYRNRSRS